MNRKFARTSLLAFGAVSLSTANAQTSITFGYTGAMEILEYPCDETPELQPFCSGTISLFR